MRKSLVLGTLALAVAGSALAAVPASAADTTVTFTVGSVGLLSVSPGLWAPGTPATDTITGTIATTITDTRIPATGTPNHWTDTVSSTGFGLVGIASPTGSALIAPGNATMWTPTAAPTIPGTATIGNTHTTTGTAVTLSSGGGTLLTASTTNANETIFTSNVSISTLNATTGAYTGAITQTISSS